MDSGRQLFDRNARMDDRPDVAPPPEFRSLCDISDAGVDPEAMKRVLAGAVDEREALPGTVDRVAVCIGERSDNIGERYQNVRLGAEFIASVPRAIAERPRVLHGAGNEIAAEDDRIVVRGVGTLRRLRVW